VLLGGAATPALAALGLAGGVAPAGAIVGAKGTTLGELLQADDSGFVHFVPDKGETPGLRAGVVEFFELDLPARWKQVQVANILSGNYCQPRCGEPWVEVEFDGPEGHVQVWVSPQDKLTNGAQPGLRIDEIGNTRGIITSLGPYVTGNTLDPDDEVMDESVVQRDGQTYFQYEIFSPYAKPGQEHGFVSVAARGECVCWLAVTASDDKWDKSFNTLQKIGESFVA
jgi:hypothetical protein